MKGAKKCAIIFGLILPVYFYVVMFKDILKESITMKLALPVQGNTSGLSIWDSVLQNLNLGRQVQPDRGRYYELIELRKSKLYLYSAAVVNYHTSVLRNRNTVNENTIKVTEDSYGSNVILIGWEHVSWNTTTYDGCIWYDSNEIYKTSVIEKRHFNLNSTLRATEFVFSLPMFSTPIRLLSLVVSGEDCPNNDTLYTRPFFTPTKPEPGLAICGKIAYLDHDARFLVEWFEIQKLLGVSKVLTFTYRLNIDAMRVLKYYKSIGLAEILPFDFPDKENLPRKIGDKTSQMFSDHEVAVFDCQERLRHYRFVTVIDKDEIALADTASFRGSLISSLNKIFRANPTVAALLLKTKIHIMDRKRWDGPGLLTANFTRCSPAVLDRTKNIYMPRRILPGSLTTHMLAPLPGYHWLGMSPDRLVLHHYRTARPSYTGGKIQIPFDQQCPRTAKLARLVANSTLAIQKELGLLT